MPIKGLTEQRRMPRIGKIHLGIKVTTNKKGEECAPYPRAVDYFVYPKGEALGGELLDELTKAYGEKPKELRIIFPLEDEESIASQYFRCYTRTRGLVCRGDGEICMRVLDSTTSALPTKDTKETAMKEMDCQGRECPDYLAKQCREVMNLQFMLPEISGMGVWQIDTSSINSIRNINSCLQMIKAVYGRMAMVPLALTLEKMEVTPPGGTKKNVFVLNIRSTDTMIEAAIKARKPPLELITGPPDIEQAEADIAQYWPVAEEERKLSDEKAAERMTQEEIAKAQIGEEPLSTEGIPSGEPRPTREEVKEYMDERKATRADSKPFDPLYGRGESEPIPEPDERVGFIDMEWLKKSIETLRDKKLQAWTESNLLSYMKTTYKVEAGTVFEAVAKLDEGAAKHFVNLVQDTLDLA